MKSLRILLLGYIYKMAVNTYTQHIFFSLWNTYAPWLKKEDTQGSFNNTNALDEFFFVILGGYGISYEENLSAFEVLKRKGYMSYSLYNDMEECSGVIKKVYRELSTPQFYPLTHTGERRRYRFTQKKAKEFVCANYWLWQECQWDILKKLKEVNRECQRKWLCNCPGIGIKSASWLLRNIGVDEDYAILDTHILRFLERIGFEVPTHMTDSWYRSIEEQMQHICQSLGIPLGKMDYLLWVLGRQGFLSNIKGG